MPSKNYPYAFSDDYVLRTSLLPVSFFTKLTAGDVVADEDLKNAFNIPVVKEAIFLATPVLYNELQKWVDGQVNDPKKIEKLRDSLLKYFSRMSSRCTPFGLFAGCAVGSFANTTNIIVDPSQSLQRHTRLDMNFLVALSQHLTKNDIIKPHLNFSPNSSLYRVGGQLRYIEYEYRNGTRQHHIMAVEDSEYLTKLLNQARAGIKYGEMISLLTDSENDEHTVKEFIDDVIGSQLLISDLEPAVSGPSLLDHIIETLSEIDGITEITDILVHVRQMLTLLDTNIGNEISMYTTISDDLKKLGVEFDITHLFQTDMFLNASHNTLSNATVDSVRRAISLLNKISTFPKSNTLTAFRDAFYERYEDREVPIAQALDVEVGLGYKQNQNLLDINPLIDDLMVGAADRQNEIQEIKWTKFNTILHKKLIDAYSSNKFVLSLSDEDVEHFEEKWDDLPDTMSSMVEIVLIDGKEKVIINSAGGSSAANLLGRFCHGDEKLNTHVHKIVEHEARINHGKIMAEIVHLPESRVGNILMRPILREYEIPYLAKSFLNDEKKLPIDDLHISVKGGKIMLRSKRHGKEVLPRLSNAHNYVSNSLPIYQFLTEMQTQQIRPSLYFNFGALEAEYSFIPRVEFNDVILSEAMWILKQADIEPLFEALKEGEDALRSKIAAFRSLKRIPQYVLLLEGDHELLINLENITSLKMFINLMRKSPVIKIKEILGINGGIVTNGCQTDYFNNQVIISLYKNVN